ncbi:MAG: alpha-amylase [Thalassobius sp.]|nr:alpha-amylase [Thalassovita sp.]
MKNAAFIFLFSAISSLVLLSCDSSQKENKENMSSKNKTSEQTEKLAYRNGGVTYEVFVQSFFDANNDGIGDLQGLTQKLDYIADLGAEAIWLMPVHPSPSYHKYDVIDYYNIHQDYGTLEDFKHLVEEAHQRNLKVILDLVINHTSDQNQWFKESVKGKNNPYRDFYIWADLDTIKEVGETKEVTGDSDNKYLWNEVPGNEEKYFGFFWKGMPDLNYDHPAVREEVYKIGKFWLTDINIDGFRLDAAKHIYPDERIDDTVEWWIAFRNEMEQVKPDVFLVGEVWDEAKVIAPFLNGLHAIFNFDLSFALQDALKNEDASQLLDKFIASRKLYKATRPDFYDAIFTTNHDQNRILSELDGNLEKGKLAASILLTLPGSPFIYYGEELGMLGVKPDEKIREPFVWSAKDSSGIPTWIEPEYNTAKTLDALDKQVTDSSSIYNHYKNLIQLRKNNGVLREGEIEVVKTKSKKVLCYYRILGNEKVLIVHNLGKKAQKLDSELLKGEILFKTVNKNLSKNTIPAYSSFIISN